MQAEIITIGDEILIGQIVDSNSAWIASELNKIGINVYQITSVSDEKKHILHALNNAQQRSEIVIITGGLGPTKDDITKSVLCEYFNTKLIHSESVMENVKVLLKTRGINDLNEQNIAQALIPENCIPLQNSVGTAPGMLFEREQTFFFSIPGVPFEMKYLMKNHIIPFIRDKYNDTVIIHKVIMTQGIFEAQLAKVLFNWEKSASEKGIKIAYLPQPGIIRIRLSIKGKDEKQLTKIINDEIINLNKIIPEYIYGYDEEMPYETIAKLLISNKLTISTAESCTGGYISHLLTSISGSSAYYTGSVIAYSNEIKQNILKIPEKILIEHGAVSKQVVEKMALNIRQIYKTDYAIATSGIAGPDGGTDSKPVGTTWIAISSNQKVYAQKFLFGENRERNIRKTAMTAFALLRKIIISEK